MAPSKPQNAAPGDPSGPAYVPLVAQRVQEKSEQALAPGDLLPYRSARSKHYTRYSGWGRDLDEDERAECNAYHDERRRTRQNEALAPGRLWHRVRLLDVRDYKGDDVREKPVPAEGFTMRVKHPEEKKYYWTRPTRWRDGQGCGIPKFALHSNALTGTESRVLCILWDCKSHWHWHVDGDAYVSGLTQASIGDKIASGQSRRPISEDERAVLSMVRAADAAWQLDALRQTMSRRKGTALDALLEDGFLEEDSGEVGLAVKGRRELEGTRAVGLHHSAVSRAVSSLDEKGFLTFNRGGDGQPGEYYLACQEKAGWTYAALDPHSGRARIIKMAGHSQGSEQIDWRQAITTTWKPPSAAARRARARRMREAEKDLDVAAQIKRAEQPEQSADTRLTSGQALEAGFRTLVGFDGSEEVSESQAEAIKKGLEDARRDKAEREAERRRRRAQCEKEARERQAAQQEDPAEREERLRRRRAELEQQAQRLNGLPPPDE